MKNKKAALLTFAIAACLTGVSLQYSSGFSVSKITLNLPLKESEEGPLPELSQPYKYLSHGRQSFVFESADGKSVIKFFNQNYSQPRWYRIFWCSRKGKKHYEKKIALRQKFYETSYPLAWKELPEETGVFYVHLYPSKDRLPKISLIDPSGRMICVDLNKTAFVLQKKASSYLSYMKEISEKEGAKGLIREIDRWLAFCEKRMDLLIFDNDHDIWNNIGILDGKLCFIDPGKFYQTPGPISLKSSQLEWWKATHRLYKWLLTNNLEAASYLYEKTCHVCILQKPPKVPDATNLSDPF